MQITFKGTAPKKPSLKVPGWGGDETNDQFQPWHAKQFADAAHTGLELIYNYEDAVVSSESCPEPFYKLSDMYYGLLLDNILSSTESLLIVPHYRFYTDPTWSTPLPVTCLWERWWPFPMTVIFRYMPKATVFTKGEPFAQVLPQIGCTVAPMGTDEQRLKESAARHILEHKDKYTTRKWKTSSGMTQDNIYNVISNLEQLPGDLIEKTKKFRVIKCLNGAKSKKDVEMPSSTV